MSDQTDHRKPNSWTDFLGPDDLSYFVVLLISVCCLALAAVSAIVYPIAWMLGFKPRRWWRKSDSFPWLQFVLIVWFVAFFGALAAACAIVVFANYH